MNWYKIDKELLPTLNTIVKLKLAGKTICLINYECELYATAWKCPHAGADLSTGWCEDKRLICPYHRHAFDLSTGRGAEGQGNYINTYKLEKRGGDWFIRIKTGFFQRLFHK